MMKWTMAMVVVSLVRLMAAPVDWMPRSEDSTQLWWQDGAPKVMNSDQAPASEILCFQYGTKQLRFDTRHIRLLDTRWDCSLVVAGQRYECRGRAELKDEFFQPVRFVECGKWFHRVVIDGLTFADAQGRAYEGKATLEISVWPDRVAFRLLCEDAVTARLQCGEKTAEGAKSVMVEMVGMPDTAIITSELPVVRDEALGCHQLRLPEKPWSNAAGTYYPQEHLDRRDRWRFSVRNVGDAPTVARLMFTQEKHLPITGFTPMICDAEGRPTGHLLQISKNWHQRPEKGHLPHEGTWFHGCLWLRVPAKSTRDFTLQMVYARYGGVCAASHAQLSLIGWGHNQFWDQAAVGSFGESICFEPGRVQRRCFITDVRPLMTLPREQGAKPWGWAGNCGGGDFLLWMDEQGRYQPMKKTRTTVRSHGPCLTDVRYEEESRGGEISSRIDVSVPAANDHLRTMFRLRYEVKKNMRWQRLAFFQLGADFYNETPAQGIATGDQNGMREEWTSANKSGAYDRVAMPLTGEQPWFSIHGVKAADLRPGRAAASRGLIVRSWRAVLGGKTVGPHLSTFCSEWGKGNHRTALELSPPPGVRELLPGDFVEAEVEWVVFPSEAAAYYGPDQAFAAMLQNDANTWRPVQREAQRRAFTAKVVKGERVMADVLTIAVDARQQARVELSGGLGHIPVRFVGLTSPDHFRLKVKDQVVSDWQTDWIAESKTWRVTANIAADAAPVVVLLEPNAPK
jgi:hypothetical protein